MIQKMFIIDASRSRESRASQLRNIQQPAAPNVTMPSSVLPTVLHLGDPIRYNPELYKELEQIATVIRPPTEERQREAFLQALKEKRWGDFSAIMRPFWNSGGEMDRWDSELITHLPPSVKLFASAGAGYDWVDVDTLAEAGKKTHQCWRWHWHSEFLKSHSRRCLLQWSYSIFRGSG